MSKASKKIPIELPPATADRKIHAAAKVDPDAQPLSASQLESMVPLRAVRGRPESEHKRLLRSVRYSPEVIAYFKSTGEGWQARMDGVLKQYVQRHSHQT